ncbi:MAG: FAD-dependent oxidoreductase [Cyanobacteria bacterium J06559_1]
MVLLDVVVVGAGMAGLVCAQRLQQAGYQISVLEKSRGLGGRMATRRVDGVPIDHGARFLHPQGVLLARLKQQLVQQELLIEWRPHSFYLDRTGQLIPEPYVSSYDVAPTGMSVVGKALGAGLSIHRQQRVVAIAPATSPHWQITAERTDNGATLQYAAKALVLAIPAPQITPLLQPLLSQPQVNAMARAIAAVEYDSCVTVMARYAEQMPAPLPCQSTEPWMVEGYPNTPFFWVGLDSSKRQVPSLHVVLHSSAAFARQWIDSPHLQDAGATLLAQAGKLITPWLAKPMHWQIHRWRYALVKEPCAQAMLSVSTPLPLVACGDWCGDQQIDTAMESGWLAAIGLNSLLGGKPLADTAGAIL